MIRAIVIDDEQLARDVVKTYLEKITDVELIGECSNGFEGLKMIQEEKPDLIFLDIQMPKITGFEMLELIDEAPVVIFTTAYDEFALKAFEINAADYLLKPFSFDRFNEAFVKARSKFVEGKKTAKKIAVEAIGKPDSLERIAIKNGNNIVIIPIEKLEYVEAQDDYVALHSEGRKYLKQYTMKFLENALPKNKFVRVHRSFIINVDQILKLEVMTKDSFVAILKNAVQVPVSRSGYNLLKELLGI